MTPEEIADAAVRLDEAERTRKPIRQLSLQYPDMTIDEAYAVQHAWVGAKLSAGRTLRGRKIGLTSRAMQQAVSITEPDYGALFDDMFFEDTSTVPHDRFIRPRVEVELAFVLGRPLKGPGATLFDVLSATERDGDTWVKQGRSGTLTFSEHITEFRDQHGELVVTVRGVAVHREPKEHGA